MIALEKPAKSNFLNKNWRKTKSLSPNIPEKTIVKINSKNEIKNLKYRLLKTKKTKTHLTVYTYSVSKTLIKQTSKVLNIEIKLTENLNNANIFIGLKSHLRKNKKLVWVLEKKNVPVFVITENIKLEIEKILSEVKVYNENLLESSPKKRK